MSLAEIWLKVLSMMRGHCTLMHVPSSLYVGVFNYHVSYFSYIHLYKQVLSNVTALLLPIVNDSNLLLCVYFHLSIMIKNSFARLHSEIGQYHCERGSFRTKEYQEPWA